MNMFKKLLSVTLALVFLMTSVPMDVVFAEEAAPEVTVVESPVVEEPVVEEPVVEEPVVEEPVVEEPVVEEPVVEEPVVEEPVVEEPVVEEPVVEEPVVEEPVVEEPVVEEPVVEEPVVEEPVVEEPVVEEPVVVEPTAEPTPEPTAAPVINSLADDTSFAKGYVYTLRAVKAYDHPTQNDYTLTIAKGEAVYVVSRPNAGASKDRVEIRFNKDGKSTAAYVDANKVMYYQGEALDAMLKNASIDKEAIFLGKNNTNPLLPVSYELYVAPTAEPTATPAPTAEPLPTTQPDDGVTESIVDLPVADEVDPDMPTKPEVDKYLYENLINKNLWTTTNSSTVYYYNNTAYSAGQALPQSPHNYGNGVDQLYRLTYASPVSSITFNFSTSCAFENNWDALIVYNASGDYVTYYTGTQLAGKTLTVAGNTIYLRLVTDSSVNNYGFKVNSASATALSLSPAAPRMSRIYGDTNGKITLEWTNPSSAERFVIQRAVINKSTGKVGSYSSIKYGTGATTLSYTDTSAVNGNLYAYRIRVYNVYNGSNYYSDFVNARYYSFKQPTITGEGAMGGTVGLRHQLRWNSIPYATRYQVLRSVSETGTYGLIAETTATNYIAVVGGFRPFWFKIRAFVEVAGREYGGGTLATSPSQMYAYPDTVQNVKTSTSGTNVTITWDKISSSCPINGYVIYRCPTTTGDFVKVGLVGTNVNRFVDNTGVMGQTYYYRVRAYRKTPTGNAYSNISTPSNSAQVGYPAVPTGVNVENGVSGRTVVTWSKANLADGYAVYRSTSSNGTYSLIGSTTNLTYNDTSISYGTYYYYKVRAYRKYNGTNLYSNYSDYDFIYTIKQPTLVGQLDTDGRPKLNWTVGNGATGVSVEISYDNSSWRVLGTSTDIGCWVNNVNTSYSKVYFRVRGYYSTYYSAYSNVVTITLNNGGGSSGGTTSGTKYRAVLIGQTYPGTSNALIGPANDRYAMTRMMDNLTSTDYEYYTYANLTGSGILSAIGTVAAKADSDDITLIYYSGHGASGGYLCGTSGYVSPYNLRQKLDQYSGKKVIISDACHSGAMISKDGTIRSMEEVTERDLANFDSAFVSAFASSTRETEPVVANSECLSNEVEYQRSSTDLAADGYYVLTACRGSELSTETGYVGDTSSNFGIFTRAMLYGCGWDCRGYTKISSLYADSNGDKKLTLNEVYNYTVSRVTTLGYGNKQHAQVYPTNSSQILFGR